MTVRFHDSPGMPRTGETPDERLARGLALIGTPGQGYVEKRGIPAGIAENEGVRYDADWSGRPAFIVPMLDADDHLRSVHGRYLAQTAWQDKMLTIGPGGGVVSVLGGWRADPMIIVEGLFDALSLAVCGRGSVATVGRWAPWLPDVCANKLVWLAFDGNRPGELEAARYRERLVSARTERLLPPGHYKDWNTALVKRGRGYVEAWLNHHLPHAPEIPS